MKPTLSIKILFRSPARTALSAALLCLVTFALFSQAAEYAITQREMKKAAAQYYGLGSVQIGPPYVANAADAGYPYHLWEESLYFDRYDRYRPTLDSTATGVYTLLTQEQMDAVAELPYVTSTDSRLMTSGISDRYYRLDEGDYLYNFTARCVIEATVLTESEQLRDNTFGDHFASFRVGDVKMLAGHLPQNGDAETLQTGNADSTHTLYGFTRNGSLFGFNSGGIGTLVRKNRQIHHMIALEDHDPYSSYGAGHMRNLIVGNRYVFVLRFGPLEQPPGGYYYGVGDFLSEPWWKAIYPLDGAPDNYLELEEFKPLRDLIAITSQDSRTFDMVYTEDMASIMRFADGRMEITQGRMLNKEDSAKSYAEGSINGAAPCLVSREFAAEYGLGVGDKLTMKLGMKLFEQYVSLGAVAGTRERFAPPEKTAELEIVGIYANTDAPRARSRDAHWAYSINTIFVPKSLLPLDADALPGHEYARESTLRGVESDFDGINHFYEYKVDDAALPGHGYAPGEFSFIIENARDIRPFLEQAEPMIWDMGLTLIFYDGGWRFVEQGFLEVGRLSVVKLILFTAASAAATCLAVYLFIGRRKKDYAIMRALGTPGQKAGKALAIPLLAVTAISVLLGGAASCLYTLSTIEKNNAFVALEQYAVDASIPAPVIIGCALGQLALTLFIALIMLRRIGALSPLVLLQSGAGDANRREKPPKGQTYSKGAPMPSLAQEGGFAGHGSEGYGPKGPGDLPAADPVSRPAAARAATQAPYSTPRTLRFLLRYIMNHIRRSSVKSALAGLLAALLFFAVGWVSELKASYADLLATTANTVNFIGEIPPKLLYQLVLPGYISGEYYEGVSKQVRIRFNGMKTEPMSMTVTNDVARYYGRDVEITYDGLHDATTMNRFGRVLIIGRGFADAFGLAPGDAVAVFPADADNRLFSYNVIGVLENRNDDQVYTPGNDEPLLSNSVEALEITLEHDGLEGEYREYAREMIMKSGESVTIVTNSANLENLKNAQRLTDMLYPMAVAAALLIGGFLCCLLILQSSREAAIMRVLGTTKGKTRLTLAAEQALLSAAGLVAGTLGMLSYKGFAPGALTGQMRLFAALYLSMILTCALICSAIATHPPPLELLQIKE